MTRPQEINIHRQMTVRLAIVRGEGGDVITKQLAKHKGSSNKLALLGAQVRCATFENNGKSIFFVWPK